MLDDLNLLLEESLLEDLYDHKCLRVRKTTLSMMRQTILTKIGQQAVKLKKRNT